MQMNGDLIRKIAADSQENQELREVLTRKEAVLISGLEICQRYVGHGTLCEFSKPISMTPFNRCRSILIVVYWLGAVNMRSQEQSKSEITPSNAPEMPVSTPLSSTSPNEYALLLYSLWALQRLLYRLSEDPDDDSFNTATLDQNPDSDSEPPANSPLMPEENQALAKDKEVAPEKDVANIDWGRYSPVPRGRRRVGYWGEFLWLQVKGNRSRFITSSFFLALHGAYFQSILHSLLQWARQKDSDNDTPKFESQWTVSVYFSIKMAHIWKMFFVIMN